MRRKVLMIFAVAAAGMLLLTACTSSENKDMQEAGAGTSGTAVSGTTSQSSDTSDPNSGVDNPTSTGDGGSESSGQDSTSQSGQDVVGIPVESGTSGSDTTASGSSAQGGGTTSSGQEAADGSAAGTVSGEFDGVYQAGTDETETETGDIWTGVYGNDAETLTITYIDSGTISFTFAESGIYGKAEVKGYQAVYKGDDYHVVVFNIHDNIVDVSVSSEEDYDTSGSPLIGTYIKDYVRDTLEEDTEADLNE